MIQYTLLVYQFISLCNVHNDDEIDDKKGNVQILVVVRHVNNIWPIVVGVKKDANSTFCCPSC